MPHVPSYGKILTLGSTYTENALNGPVIIQEKVDGSLFAFGLDENGELAMRSKGQQVDPLNPDKMFAKAIEYITSIKDRLPKGVYFYCEYLQKPKHNTLRYERTPKNNLVMFDATERGVWLDRVILENLAKGLEIDIVPELCRGEATIETIKGLLTTPSYLGNEIIEGVVIKNYGQKLELQGKICPLFTKFVREEFKERHETDWKIRSPKGAIQLYIEAFRSEPRWQKAFQYLRDNGQLEVAPRDIPKLIKRVQEDIVEEEMENIKNELYKQFGPEILRTSIKGLPEWYKNKLLENVK